MISKKFKAFVVSCLAVVVLTVLFTLQLETARRVGLLEQVNMSKPVVKTTTIVITATPSATMTPTKIPVRSVTALPTVTP